MTTTKTSSLRLSYLTAYNALFCILWTSILYTTLTNLPNGKPALFAATSSRARWIQTATLIEIIHAATGLVKSPVSTTALQVTTRTIQVWMIWFSFPASTASSHAYAALVLAWSLADAIRYAYLTLNLHARSPGWLVWLRYTMFYPLYPIGITSEWWLLYRAIEPAGQAWWGLKPIFWACLAAYVPGSYTMYTHMIKQRRKTLGGGKKAV
ncbi:tyrosine phosphatase-like protein [Paraphoma chrysanthemicola]|uniref:Very-long-chain (3R)-3-hydroxyacyl-CoA dehydratase n=1 Tax=Paraphoma chrysanthemicola TaxID=798071 RepID=A0A8K0QWB6_9PLEO|nr:tyrosine phosphatase-like protein [Paraphoma chrysanthemicola]